MNYGIIERLAALTERLAETRMTNPVLALRVYKTRKAILTTLEPFYEARADLVREYGEADGSISPDSPRWSEFQPVYAELLNEDATVDLTPIALDALEGMEITPADLGLMIEAGVVTVPDP